MKRPSLDQLASLIKDEGIARGALSNAIIRIGDAAAADATYIAQLEAALQPFAGMYAQQLRRRGPEWKTDNPAVCFCTRRDPADVGAAEMRIAYELLEERKKA